MTLHDQTGFTVNPLLFVPVANFPQVTALPERHTLPGAELLVFRFANGYGAAVTRQMSRPDDTAFEFCVLDCTLPEPQPCLTTPVAAAFRSGLSHTDAHALLMLAERLPLHERCVEANTALIEEEF
ncbi:hypothetical protein GO986_19845 [Deinococcus sp. HMF7620]|uniref:Uncharacterized protein n=1 Tax=Deinococcus arboris TaxID=2682977 RepID=A0A7C9LQZ8_9DEIO|nr:MULTISPECIES: hypothetical protein [Deinococcus]MBZ9752575.1 hypothetical protein [Deinococcus betulae]MVN88996.1 hypothetical protein [Deinococcus arboris]